MQSYLNKMHTEEVEVDTLYEWVKCIRRGIQVRIPKLKKCPKQICISRP